MRKKKKNNNQKVIVKLRSGKKIEVNRYEQIKLPDGKVKEITKVSLFNKLLTHRFIPRVKYVATPKRDVLIPILPPEAHLTWSKNLWFWVEKYQKGAIKSHFVKDGLPDKWFFNQYRKDIKVEGKPIMTRVRLIELFQSKIFVAEDYTNALPITTSYRKCPFCSSTTCIRGENVGIRTDCEENLSKYTERFSLEYAFCKKYKRKSFITILQDKKIINREKIICRFCGSDSRKILNPEFSSFLFDLYRKTLANKKLLKEIKREPEQSDIFFLNHPDLFKDLYECDQCYSIFDKYGSILLRPLECKT